MTRDPPRCKRCGRLIEFGKVTGEVIGTLWTKSGGRFGPERKLLGKWIPLDPDGMPHDCKPLRE